MKYAVALLMVLFPVWGLAATPGQGAAPPPVVAVVTIAAQDVNKPAEYVGHVEAVQSVDLRARVEGVIERVEFREGQDVHAGDLLYVIEQAPYRAKVAADKAKVEEARANLDRASRHLQRLKSARPESVRATDIDNAVADEAQAKAQLLATRAQLTASELDLGYTEIRAPIDGRIGRTAFTRGNMVNASSGTLARIVQLDPIRVVYSISENDMTSVRKALKDAQSKAKNPLLAPRLRLADNQLVPTVGRIDFVDNEVDAATGTIAVHAVFGNHDHLLLPGQYATVLVSLQQPRILPMVPQASVLTNQKGRYVLIVDEQGIAIPRPITTGPTVGTMWAVESGVKTGDRVIVGGIQKVRPGQKVQVAPDQKKGR
jgi:RND family efflux transporter MFP subunit